MLVTGPSPPANMTDKSEAISTPLAADRQATKAQQQLGAYDNPSPGRSPASAGVMPCLHERSIKTLKIL